MRVAFGDFQLDTEARTLERERRRVPVEPKVFDLLVYLIEHRERVAFPEELLPRRRRLRALPSPYCRSRT